MEGKKNKSSPRVILCFYSRKNKDSMKNSRVLFKTGKETNYFVTSCKETPKDKGKIKMA